jgi:hypothetical protein
VAPEGWRCRITILIFDGILGRPGGVLGRARARSMPGLGQINQQGAQRWEAPASRRPPPLPRV